MANLVRVRVSWNGSPVVGEGVSTFYFDEAHTGFVADLTALFADLSTPVPSGVSWVIPNTGDLIDIATGALSGTWTDGTAGTPGAGNLNDYAAGVGMRIQWGTSGIRNGRRVKGSTFIVPIGVNYYDSNGTLDTGLLAAMQTSVNTFFTACAGNLRIYSRPTDTQSGQENVAISATLVDRVSWLRSRRT